MEIKNDVLVNDLLERVQECTRKAKQFEIFKIEQLRFKEDGRWSILECLEHLNLYGDFYLVEIEKRILQNQHRHATKFKSGLLGNYFANLMEVKKDVKIRKMKSPKDKNPENTSLSVTTISRFLKQQDQLVSLLNQCRTLDLTRIKTGISLTNLIKLRLGDTLRFYTYHLERHIKQASDVAESLRKV
jgi:hypothetical protein